MANKERQPYRALKGKIIEEGKTIKELAAVLKITPGTLSRKLNNRSPFFAHEAAILCAELNIKTHEMNKYIFPEHKFLNEMLLPEHNVQK